MLELIEKNDRVAIITLLKGVNENMLVINEQIALSLMLEQSLSNTPVFFLFSRRGQIRISSKILVLFL